MATPSALTRSHPQEYRRHRPEATLLYQVIEEYWPEFQVELTGRGKSLPAYITAIFLWVFPFNLHIQFRDLGFFEALDKFCSERCLADARRSN